MTRRINTIQQLNVLVRDRSGVLFEGEAEAVSSLNQKGLFDILPLHANFISLISKSVIIHLRDKEPKEIPIETGVLKIRDDNIEIYVGIVRV